MPEHFPISAAKALAKAQGCSQIIIAAWDGERTHIVTYGDTVEACDQAAQGGDKIKAALGWTDVPMALPSRVQSLLGAATRVMKAHDAITEYLKVGMPARSLLIEPDRAEATAAFNDLRAAIARATNTEPQPDKNMRLACGGEE